MLNVQLSLVQPRDTGERTHTGKMGVTSYREQCKGEVENSKYAMGNKLKGKETKPGRNRSSL